MICERNPRRGPGGLRGRQSRPGHAHRLRRHL